MTHDTTHSIDTLYIARRDTVYQYDTTIHYDSVLIYDINYDTLILLDIQMETTVVKDTLYRLDTLVRRDTTHSYDTVFWFDTVYHRYDTLVVRDTMFVSGGSKVYARQGTLTNEMFVAGGAGTMDAWRVPTVAGFSDTGMVEVYVRQSGMHMWSQPLWSLDRMSIVIHDSQYDGMAIATGWEYKVVYVWPYYPR